MDRFTKFDGRIARGDWWLGLLILMIMLLVGRFVIALVVGGGTPGLMVDLIWALLVLVGYGALCTRRLQDRGKPAMPWVAIFVAPIALLSIMRTFEIGFEEQTVEFAGALAVALLPNGLGYAAYLVVGVAVIWALVELGALRGTVGENAYGPDPVA